MIGLSAHRLRFFFTLLCFLPAVTVQAEVDDKSRIEGAWNMVGRLTDSGEIRETATRAVKFIMAGRWCVTAWDPKSGEVVYHHGGTYTFDGEKYTEKISYVAPLQSTGNLGNTFEFKIEFDGNRFKQWGVGNPYNQLWDRFQDEK